MSSERFKGVEEKLHEERFPGKEKRETDAKPVEVVRVVIFQSVSPEMIAPETSLVDIEFTQAVFADKIGANTGGQTVPVGGNIDADESPEDAARRETREETHAGTSLQTTKKFAEQEYSFPHEDRKTGKKTVKKRKVHWYWGRMLPRDFDKQYAINPLEDNIEGFTGLSITQLNKFLHKGRVVVDGKEKILLDSLRRDGAERTKAGVTTSQSQVENIHSEMFEYAVRVEAEKKMSVLEHLLWGMNLEGRVPEDKVSLVENRLRHNLFDRVQTIRRELWAIEKKMEFGLLESTRKSLRIRGQELAAEATLLWQDLIARFNVQREEVLAALSASNAEGVRDFSSEVARRRDASQRRLDESLKGAPTSVMVTGLLTRDLKSHEEQQEKRSANNEDMQKKAATDRPNLRLFRTLFRHPQMARFLKLGVLLSHLRMVQVYGEKAPVHLSWLTKRLDSVHATAFPVDKETVHAWQGTRGIPKQMMLYLTEVHRTIASKDQERGEALIEPEFLEELEKLGTDQPGLGRDVDMFLRKLTSQPEWHKMRTAAVVEGADLSTLIDLIARDGKGVDLPPDANLDRVGWEAMRKLKLMYLMFEIQKMTQGLHARGVEPIHALLPLQEEGEAIYDYETGVTSQDATIEFEAGQRYEVRCDARVKKDVAFLLKIIIRDDLSPSIVEDLFGRAIIFKEKDPLRCREMAEFCKKKMLYKGKGDIEAKEKELFVPHVVGELMEHLVKEGKKQNAEVVIENFKILPKDKSSGPGGSGLVHFVKFDVYHVREENGVRVGRREEYQVFPPRIDEAEGESVVITGEADYVHKKADDKIRSDVRKIFNTKSLRSAAELLFPVEIYDALLRDISWNKIG